MTEKDSQEGETCGEGFEMVYFGSRGFAGMVFF
jgi:hypothetical protein